MVLPLPALSRSQVSPAPLPTSPSRKQKCVGPQPTGERITSLWRGQRGTCQGQRANGPRAVKLWVTLEKADTCQAHLWAGVQQGPYLQWWGTAKRSQIHTGTKRGPWVLLRPDEMCQPQSYLLLTATPGFPRLPSLSSLPLGPRVPGREQVGDRALRQQPSMPYLTPSATAFHHMPPKVSHPDVTSCAQCPPSK